jgi:hypothetical protein
VFVDDVEQPGDATVTQCGDWTFCFCDGCPDVRDFVTSFDTTRPTAGGVVRRLSELQPTFRPQVVTSQSTNNVIDVVDPDSPGCYSGPVEGGVQIDIPLADTVAVPGISIAGELPRAFTFAAPDEMRRTTGVAEVANAEGPCVTEFEQPLTGSHFRLSQAGPNAQGGFGVKIAKIEFLGGIFRRRFDQNREDIWRFVSVSAKSNQSDKLYRLGNFNTVAANGIQLSFPLGKVEIGGHAIRRDTGKELRHWSLIASNDDQLVEWTELHRVNELRK